MKNFLKIILLFKIIWITSIVYLHAASGAASVYKITMRKVELCTASTSVDTCENALVIGSDDLVVDIASVAAGSSIANYGNPALLPLGTTYTHMRVTIDRKITVKSDTIDTGSSASTDTCRTIAIDDTHYGSGSNAAFTEANRKYTHNPLIAEGGTSGEMNLYLKSDNYSICALANCSANAATDQDMTYTATYSTYQEQHAEGDSTDDHMLVYALTSPFTVGLNPPKVDISFGTQTAVGVGEVDASAGGGIVGCQFYANEPEVTITIN
ncbi:hypothetical protein [Candidatus Pelagibacter sp.]|uniref:hypothetical protein n=1 Tax=Candidatus Pelagibacter sp. TaxID=2024849 RepID=UPI003D105240